MKKLDIKPIITKEIAETSKKVASLDGFKALRISKMVTKYQVFKHRHPVSEKVLKIEKHILSEKTFLEESIPLKEIPEEMIDYYRKTGIPSFLLKADGKFFYATIRNDIDFLFSNILGLHKCGLAGKECSRLSAASDENGGCAKVRNYSRRIELYPWITKGFETFNTTHDSFSVVECDHYKIYTPKEPMSVVEVNNAKLAIAQYVWDDVNSIKEVEARKRRNRGY